MTKTLADMTAEERAACVGMWCDNLVSTADNPRPVVLSCVQGERCWVLHINLYGTWSCFPLGSVSPRFDMPRIWTPDGEPVEMDVEHEVVQKHPRGGMIGTFENPEYTSLVPGTEVKRWVSDWEPA